MKEPIKRGLTDAEVEAEIDRLRHSEDVKLARKYEQYQYRRRQAMYQLRLLEKKGKELRECGFTLENFSEMIEADEEDLQ